MCKNNEGYTVIGVDIHHPKPIYTVLTPIGTVTRATSDEMKYMQPLLNCRFDINSGKVLWWNNIRPQGNSPIQYSLLGTYNDGRLYKLASQSGDIHLCTVDGYRILLERGRVHNLNNTVDLGYAPLNEEESSYINLYDLENEVCSLVPPVSLGIKVSEYDGVFTRQLNDLIRLGLSDKLGKNRVKLLPTLGIIGDGTNIEVPSTLVSLPHLQEYIELSVIASNTPDLDLNSYWVLSSNRGSINQDKIDLSFDKLGITADWSDRFRVFGQRLGTALLKQSEYSLNVTNGVIWNSIRQYIV